MKKNILIKKMSYLFMLVVLFASCNKEKRFSNRLQKGEKWMVESIRIAGEEVTGSLGFWLIKSDVDIYEQVPSLVWERNAESTLCEWQFQDKGKSFQLNYYQLCEECDGTLLDSLDYDAYNLTGNYTVERKNRKQMEFRSNSTVGYSNSEVVISIQRQ